MKIRDLTENDNIINTTRDIGNVVSIATGSAGVSTALDIGRMIIRGAPPEFRALQQRARQSATEQRSPVFFRIDTRAPGVFRLVKRAVGALGGDTRTYFIVQPNGSVESVSRSETRGLPEVT